MKRSKRIPLLGFGLTLFLNKPHLIYGNSSYGGGSGTESDPYLISTPEHLNQLQLDVNMNGFDTTGIYYQLTNNIDLLDYDNDLDETNGNFTPIGDSINTFKGLFDGNNNTISNVEIILPDQNYIGVFGHVVSATIQNLKLKGITIEGKSYVGGLIGYQSEGLVQQNYVGGKISGIGEVGGMIGEMSDGTVSKSCSDGNVSGEYYVGGLVGYKHNGTMNQTCSISNIEGEDYIGGLIGFHNGGTINQNYATGKVTGIGEVGGLIGWLSDGAIDENYSIGRVIGDYDVGGLIGFRTHSATIKNSYWDRETSGQNISAGGGDSLTTEQMTKENSKTNMNGFNFDDIWMIGDYYPIFKWQLKKDAEIQLNGTVQTMIADVTIPSISPDLVINPNLPECSVSPEFSVSNDSVSPIKLELKTFEQTTNTFNDVLPTKYSSWEGLNKTQSQDIALGLVAKEGEGWQQLITSMSYVANHTEHEIGIIKPTSSVDFSFDVKHGTSFSEAKTVQYKMVFVFDLMN